MTNKPIMHELEKLLAIMTRLRDPDQGCPWDQQQTFETIIPFTIEEVYEVADTIEQKDYDALKDELGDLLFQIVFYAQIAKENNLFDFADIATAISNKMIRRHPHVFGDVKYSDMEEQKAAWEQIKASEKKPSENLSILDGVANALPALMRAYKLQRRASRAGFDWPEPLPVLEKVNEELEEIRDAITHNAGEERLREEVGDLLFACTNLARHLKIDPEIALRHSNSKFENRVRNIENQLKPTGRRTSQVSPEELDKLWEKVKAEE